MREQVIKRKRLYLFDIVTFIALVSERSYNQIETHNNNSTICVCAHFISANFVSSYVLLGEVSKYVSVSAKRFKNVKCDAGISFAVCHNALRHHLDDLALLLIYYQSLSLIHI